MIYFNVFLLLSFFVPHCFAISYFQSICAHIKSKVIENEERDLIAIFNLLSKGHLWEEKPYNVVGKSIDDCENRTILKY